MSEIIIYQAEDNHIKLDVNLVNEMLELHENSVCAILEHTAQGRF